MIFIITIEHSVLCWCKHVTGCADDLCHLVQELTVAAYTGDVVKTPLMPRVDLNKQTVGQVYTFYETLKPGAQDIQAMGAPRF